MDKYISHGGPLATMEYQKTRRKGPSRWNNLVLKRNTPYNMFPNTRPVKAILQPAA